MDREGLRLVLLALMEVLSRLKELENKGMDRVVRSPLQDRIVEYLKTIRET